MDKRADSAQNDSLYFGIYCFTKCEKLSRNLVPFEIVFVHYLLSIISLSHFNTRRVARVLSMWKHFKAGGLGGALRPPMEANGFYTFTE